MTFRSVCSQQFREASPCIFYSTTSPGVFCLVDAQPVSEVGRTASASRQKVSAPSSTDNPLPGQRGKLQSFTAATIGEAAIARRFSLKSGAGLVHAPGRLLRAINRAAPQIGIETNPKDGPVLITVTFRINPERAEEFIRAAHELRRAHPVRRKPPNGYPLHFHIVRKL